MDDYKLYTEWVDDDGDFETGKNLLKPLGKAKDKETLDLSGKQIGILNSFIGFTVFVSQVRHKCFICQGRWASYYRRRNYSRYRIAETWSSYKA